VPARTPEHIVTLLYRAIATAMRQPDAAEKLAVLGFDTVISTPDEFSARILTDIPKWAEVIRAAHIKAE
jgi:tripartite-type tricarboxylate transporter receptor subunit TctC